MALRALDHGGDLDVTFRARSSFLERDGDLRQQIRAPRWAAPRGASPDSTKEAGEQVRNAAEVGERSRVHTIVAERVVALALL